MTDRKERYKGVMNMKPGKRPLLERQHVTNYYRYCTSSADCVIVTVHRTPSGAARVISENPAHSLVVWDCQQPYAIAVGDKVPASAVQLTVTPYRRKK